MQLEAMQIGMQARLWHSKQVPRVFFLSAVPFTHRENPVTQVLRTYPNKDTFAYTLTLALLGSPSVERGEIIIFSVCESPSNLRNYKESASSSDARRFIGAISRPDFYYSFFFIHSGNEIQFLDQNSSTEYTSR